MRGGRRGTQHNVMKALGFQERADVERVFAPQAVGCTQTGCRGTMYFSTDGIGRMVEACDRCGHHRTYAGAPLLTKEQRIAEAGVTKDGGIRRGYGPQGASSRGPPGPYRRNGKSPTSGAHDP